MTNADPSAPESFTLEHRGCRLSATLRGNGPPVLLIQGVGIHGNGWLPQTDTLAQHYRCLTFDNRGMGQSQPTAAPLTIAQMSEDALALMDAQDWISAHIVGHSLGGLIALHLALTARPRVRSLALLCTFADGRIPNRLSPRMLWIGTRTRLGPRRSRRRAFLQLVMPPDALAAIDQDAFAAQLAPLFGHDLADQPPIVMPQLRAMKICDLTPRLAELAGISTLVLSAAHDPIAPPFAGRAIAAGIPAARYIEFPDASHGLPLQWPDRVNRLLLDHFAASQPAAPC